MAKPGEPPRNRMRWLVMLAGVFVAIGSIASSAPDKVSARGKHETPPSPQALHAGHETTDVDVRGTTGILAAIAATTALVIGIVFLMIWRFDVSRHQAWSHLTPLETAKVEPPPPRLQINPLADLERHVAQQHHLLDTYGWTSPDHSTARIPIKRAMALTVGSSLDAPP